MLRDVGRVEAESLLPASEFAEPMSFEPNEDYVRMCWRGLWWTAFDAQRRRPRPLPTDLSKVPPSVTYEITTARLALRRAGGDRVREMAQTMVADHTSTTTDRQAALA